jgi:hypothetical protein
VLHEPIGAAGNDDRGARDCARGIVRDAASDDVGLGLCGGGRWKNQRCKGYKPE